MTMPSQLKIAGVAVLLYTGWNARSLLVAWQHSPFDHADIAAWLIWILPVLPRLFNATEPRLGWLGAALALTFGSLVLDLNLLGHLALAVVCAAFVPARRSFWIWMPMALCWMPVFGWLLSKCGLGLVVIALLRVLFATLGTLSYGSMKR